MEGRSDFLNGPQMQLSSPQIELTKPTSPSSIRAKCMVTDGGRVLMHWKKTWDWLKASCYLEPWDALDLTEISDEFLREIPGHNIF